MEEETDDRRDSIESGKSRILGSKKYAVTNYKEYMDILRQIDDSTIVYMFYVGSVSPISGYSWCPLCVEASGVIEKRLGDLPDHIFVTVHVGSQDEWEDETNPFRTDKEINLKMLPTLLKYKNPKRLQGRYCLRPELVDLIFDVKFCDM